MLNRIRPVRSRLRRLAMLARSPTSLTGLIIVSFWVLMALLGPTLAPYAHTEFHEEDALRGPCTKYPFGTDEFGRDVLSRVLVGSRDILALAPVAVAVAVLAGIAVGLTAAYCGGMIDELIMRVADGMMSIPTLLLALLFLGTLGPARSNIVLAIGIVQTPGVARLVRSAALQVATQDYVAAARIRGESRLYIMFREMLPNMTGPIIVEASLRFCYAIFLTASLGFLGLGVQPPSPDWGLQVGAARNYVLTAPWMVIFPTLCIASLVIGVNFVTDGLRRLF